MKLLNIVIWKAFKLVAQFDTYVNALYWVKKSLPRDVLYKGLGINIIFKWKKFKYL